MFCPYCAKEIPNESRICGYCGKKIEVQLPDPAPVTPPPAKGAPVEPPSAKKVVTSSASPKRSIPSWVWGVGGAVVVGVVLIGALLIPNRSTNLEAETQPVREENAQERVTQADQGNPFNPAVGNWKTIDEDGSNMTMVISHVSDLKYNIVIRDDSASACGGASVQGNGSGQASDNEITLREFVFVCSNGDELVFDVVLKYNSVTDRIHDGNLYWDRQ